MCFQWINLEQNRSLPELNKLCINIYKLKKKIFFLSIKFNETVKNDKNARKLTLKDLILVYNNMNIDIMYIFRISLKYSINLYVLIFKKLDRFIVRPHNGHFQK